MGRASFYKLHYLKVTAVCLEGGQVWRKGLGGQGKGRDGEGGDAKFLSIVRPHKNWTANREDGKADLIRASQDWILIPLAWQPPTPNPETKCGPTWGG